MEIDPSEISDEIAAAVRSHAGAIILATGSNLDYFEARSKANILLAVLACYRESHKAGMEVAFAEMRKMRDADQA